MYPSQHRWGVQEWQRPSGHAQGWVRSLGSLVAGVQDAGCAKSMSVYLWVCVFVCVLTGLPMYLATACTLMYTGCTVQECRRGQEDRAGTGRPCEGFMALSRCGWS
jgi:hypothetical protein